MTAEVVTSGRPILITLKAKGLVGGKSITLEDDSGQLKVIVPAALWEFITPGDSIAMTLSPVKVTVIAAKPVLLPGLGKLDS